MFASFTQKINPTEMIKCIKCWTNKKDKKNLVQLTVLSEKEAGSVLYSHSIISASDYAVLAPYIANATPGCWLAFIPNEQFPYSAEIFVQIGPEIPSAGKIYSSKIN
jgi:hypothetical protein